jgi:uncharacterized protein involved in exopolysaccharide biosynthesis
VTRPNQNSQDVEDIDVASLGRAVWRAKGWILGLAIGAGVITFIALAMMRPLFTSEARILIQNDESTFTRPASEQAPEARVTLDEQAMQSQVQVLTSRDLALRVIKDLNLIDNPEFAKDSGVGLFGRLLAKLGIGLGSQVSREEKAANVFARHLNVYQLGKSSVIGVEYTSGSSPLAAEVANKLSDVYIAWQRDAKLEQTKDATLWLRTQIDVLRKRVAESEEAAEKFRAQHGLFAGSNNVTLSAQQLSELNSQLILAKAQSSEAQARARLIKDMLAKKGDIDATTEVLKSELITRLIEQRVTVERQLAELSATLLPSHPRMRQLSAELADVRKQIRNEVEKIALGLENEARVASAREASLRASLNDVKQQATGLSEAEIQLRALEREAKANRELLESYLTRYRDASAHHDMGAVPAQATIVSRAHASLIPSFPKKVPITLLVSLATALLALTYVLARALLASPARAPEPTAEPVQSGPSFMRERRKGPPPPPPPSFVPTPPPANRSTAIATVPPKVQSETAPPPKAPEAPSVATEIAPAPVAAKEAETVGDQPKAEAPPGSTQSGDAEEPVKTATEPSPAKETVQPKKKSRWLAWSTAPANGKDEKRDEEGEPVKTDAQMTAPAPKPAASGPSAGELSAAAGLLDRLRNGHSSSPGEEPKAKADPAPGLFGRLRRNLPGGNASESSAHASARTGTAMRPNDLRHYLNQRLAASAAESAKDIEKPAKAVKSGNGKTGPVLKSLDAVLNHILAPGKGVAPRAVLVAGATPQVDATQEAIQIARGLVARREQIVLLDLTRGAAAVSGPLGLPRAPGFTDLAAGRASFEDVVRIDSDSPLQVIAAGNPAIKPDGEETDSFMRVFEALTHVYDCVVLHADRDVMRKLRPALKFELPAAVAVLPAGTAMKGADTVELTDFTSLGCPVVVYEQNGKEPRSGLFGRLAAG